MLFFLLENFRLGLRNLILHRLRSLLTALGIIFGVAAVIIMVALGNGAKQQALKQLEQLGASNIVITAQRPPESSEASGGAMRILDYGITRLDLERLQTMPGLTSIVPMRDTERTVVIGDKSFPNVRAIGTTPQIFEVIRLRLARGTTFSDVQYDRGEAVCVLGAKAAEQMFPFQDPLGAQIMIGTPSMGTTLLTVIGVLEPTGLRADASNADIIQRDIDMDVYLPLTLAWQVFGDSNVRRQAGTFERKRIEITEVWLKANSVDEVESLSKVAENILGLPARLDVQVKAPIEILRAAEQQERTFNFVMGGIAGVSLLVGGIGIMNIMLATVTERTKEIGIRRALGAKQRHIILQFLIETTVIALAGGMIGIGLGVVVATYLDTLVTFVSWILKNAGFSPIVGAPPAVVAMWSVMASCIVSVGIGIGFGIYPAIKAARMDPIEALRHE